MTRRINEIGIRMALGATSRDVTRMVLAGALGFVAHGSHHRRPGRALGEKLRVPRPGHRRGNSGQRGRHAAGRHHCSHPLAAVAMLAVALVASYVPVRRATTVDPMVALRSE